MKKGYFISFGDSIKNNDGVHKKIIAQINAFNDCNLNCYEYPLFNKMGPIYKLKWRLPIFNVAPLWKIDDRLLTADYIYFRRPLFFNSHSIAFLKTIKKQNPQCVIVLEIPTYPYDSEYDDYKFSWLVKKSDQKNRRKLKHYVDRIVTVTDDEKIFGIQTICINNGIDLDAIQPRQFIPENDTINICAVAQFKYWHGYENELINYIKLVESLDLKDRFVFHGFLDSDELLDIYNHASLAIGTLGMYKKNLYYSCDLKSREALARGIPLVIGCKTQLYDENYKYFIEFPNDDSDLNIQSIIDFHDRIYSEESGNIVTDNIRRFGEKHVDIRVCMEPVIDYLQA